MLSQITPDDAEGGDVATRENGTAGVQHDTQLLTKPAVGFVLRVDGDIKVKTLRGSDVTFTCLACIPYSIGFKQVFDTGTTVTNAQIVLFYARLFVSNILGMGYGPQLIRRYGRKSDLVTEFGADVVADFSTDEQIWLRKDNFGGAPADNADTVGMWVDRSIYGYHMSQATSSRRPTRVDVGPDGKRWLYFDGGDLLGSTATLSAALGATAWECWVRVKAAASVTQHILELSRNTSSANGGFTLYTPSGTSWSNLTRGNVGLSQRSKSGFNQNIHTIRLTCNFALATGEADIYVDGSNAGTVLNVNSNNTGGLGDFEFFVGARFGPAGNYTGYVRKVAFFRRGLTAGEVTFMDSYMAA